MDTSVGFEGLNAEQKEAVTSTEGVIRVIAGAGSGKTRALSHRFAYLVNEMGILPEHLLCVTFTSKASNEMRRRIHALTGDNDTGYINTFHGFCVSVLREDSHAVSYPKSFLVLDNADIDDMLRLIYEERGLTLRDMTFADARDRFEIRKLKKEPEYYRDLIGMSADGLYQKYREASSAEDILFYGYLWQQKKCFGLDYNDLIILTLHIFREFPDLRRKWQERLEYIMIDEFQDIDELQYRLMEVLAGYHGNLFIVGDPDQTIYTWRGADVRFLLELDKHFRGVKTVLMNRNYRSTPQILAAANSLISCNRQRYPKDLVPTLPGGQPVFCHHARSSEEEAEWIAFRIRELHEQGVPLKDVAVLYRSHYVTRTVEAVFRRRELPYAIYSGVPFYSRAEIKDALSYLRMVIYKDDLSFRRVVNTPRRNLGQRRMRFLQEAARENGCSLYQALLLSLDDDLFKGTGARRFVDLVESLSAESTGCSVSELLIAVLSRSGYEESLRTEGSQERLDNLAELKQSVYEYEITCGEEAGPEHYLSHVALFGSGDTGDPGDRVRLMTVHAAKGLEFPYVFLCAMNEGIFPSRKTSTLPGMEEERRLAFVAMTRAERGLYLSEAEGRNLDGSMRYPSRFLLEIDPALLSFTQPPDDGLIREARAFIAAGNARLPESAPALFAAGDRVRHSIMGAGTVEEVLEGRAAYLIRFDGLDTARAISFRARLEPEHGNERGE